MKSQPFGPLDPANFRESVRRALAEDFGWGDVTTDATVPAEARGRGTFLAKAPCVVAGLDVAAEVFRQLDPAVVFTVHHGDGSFCQPGTVIAVVEGLARPLLTAERTALNYLLRLSGIATVTRRYVDVAAGRIVVLDTRKTTPGLRLLEKYAVRAGGGTNHRLALDDGILIKDNHVRLAGGVAAAMTRMRAAQCDMPIEIEAQSLEQLDEALAAGATRILADNLSLEDLREVVKRTRGRAQVEVSGGVTLERLDAIADTGAEFVSVGALTHSAPAVDISFEIEPAERRRDGARPTASRRHADSRRAPAGAPGASVSWESHVRSWAAAARQSAAARAKMIPPHLQSLLDAARGELGPFARHGRVVASTASTNDDALAWAAEGAPEGAWIVAGSQSAGRGRRGRVWASPPGAGLYLSVVFRPRPGAAPRRRSRRVPAEDPAMSLLTVMAGVAAVEALDEATGVRATLKWPNDVVVEAPGAPTRKLAGILAEGVMLGPRLSAVVVGLGVNLRPSAYPPEIAARAVALETLAGRVRRSRRRAGRAARRALATPSRPGRAARAGRRSSTRGGRGRRAPRARASAGGSRNRSARGSPPASTRPVPCGCRPAPARPGSSRGKWSGRERRDAGRRVLPRDRGLPVPRERRAPGAHRRPGVPGGRRLACGRHSVRDREAGHRSDAGPRSGQAGGTGAPAGARRVLRGRRAGGLRDVAARGRRRNGRRR